MLENVENTVDGTYEQRLFFSFRTSKENGNKRGEITFFGHIMAKERLENMTLIYMTD